MNHIIHTPINESDVVAFVQKANEQIAQDLSNFGPYEMGPFLCVNANERPFTIRAYIAPMFTTITGDGTTIENALIGFLVDLENKRPSPAKLRADAQKLIDEAAKMEASL